ncbi:hypothetical protein, partial [Cyclobacterium roseum]|uniref:hypothetical protein n=1 Tax=Cyclobacterium roseum TaxID=2666137 RepID=UPI001390B74E
GYWGKEYALTWGDLGIDSVSMGQEVSRGHNSYRERAVRATEVSLGSEGLNAGLRPNLPAGRQVRWGAPYWGSLILSGQG